MKEVPAPLVMMVSQRHPADCGAATLAMYLHGLGKMSPSVSLNDRADGAASRAVLVPDRLQGHASLSELPDSPYVRFGESRIRVLLSVLMSAARSHVVDVVLRRAKSEMVNVAASRVVATMEDIQSVWGLPVSNLIRKAMGPHQSLRLAPYPHLPIAVARDGALKFHAAARRRVESWQNQTRPSLFRRIARVWSLHVVSMDEAYRLALHHPSGRIRCLGNWRMLAAAAFAEHPHILP